MMHMTPAPDIVEEDGELRQVDGIRQLCGHLEAPPGEHPRHFVYKEKEVALCGSIAMLSSEGELTLVTIV